MAPNSPFDELVNRHGTSCLKYDFGLARKGRTDLLPMWVADMDLLSQRISSLIFTPVSITESLVIPTLTRTTTKPWMAGFPATTGTTSNLNG